MKSGKLFLFFTILILVILYANWAISNEKKSKLDKKNQIDTRIDNINYWVEKAEQGIIPFNEDKKVRPAIYTGSRINAITSITNNSPDVPVTNEYCTQSENSIFVDPNNENIVLNSNNSSEIPVTGNFHGANHHFTFNNGETWEGEIGGAGEDNRGDPATVIGLNGRWYINYINNDHGMGVSYSDDYGVNWVIKQVAVKPGLLMDKNHMWIDNNTSSPYEGNLYVAWTNFGGPDNRHVALSYSTTNGYLWSENIEISSGANAGDLNQGVNINSGPNGEVYVVWSIYDTWESDEVAIGFNKSLDGGETWQGATRIIDNIRGIRLTGTSKDMRVNSFPVVAVDNSYGPNRGAIYVSWTNIGEPGINTGDDIDVYVIKSIDEGTTWTPPIRVNQDESGLGNQHYFPWITVDPSTGIISLIYYDDRNIDDVSCEVYCANSYDGGITWEDFKVSDVSFTPGPIVRLAGSYFGDYLGITAKDGWVYPIWTDNRSGSAMAYTSPYQTRPLNIPYDLEIATTFEMGIADLIWSYVESPDFIEFHIYRDGVLIAQTMDTTYSDQLTNYGIYHYMVTAFYSGNLESVGAIANTQWGSAQITISQDSLYQFLNVDHQATQYVTVFNSGHLELRFNVSSELLNKKAPLSDYCDAGGEQYEHITLVTLGDINNTSGQSSYSDFTDISTIMNVSQTYNLTVYKSSPWSETECGAWIDWNQDKVFSEEEFVLMTVGEEGDSFFATITPEFNTLQGVCRMRIRTTYPEVLSPCGTTYYGEVEDYTINVQSWLNIDPIVGKINPGDSCVIAFTFDATDKDNLTYDAITTFASDYTATEEKNVHVTLEIGSTTVNANSDKELVCDGEEVQLEAIIVGEATVSLYSWTSIPYGFASDLQNPLAYPETDTWFFIEVSTDTGILSDSVFVEVIDCTNIDEVNDKLKISVYPNPSSGLLNIKLMSDYHNEASMKVVSVTGSVVFEKQNIIINSTSALQIDLRHLPDGTYNISISSNETVVSKRIVISK